MLRPSLDEDRTMTPEDIVEQREKGWVDFHPETYCHLCGGRNVWSWFAPNGDWNTVREQIRAVTPSEIICPPCFAEIYEAAHPDELVIWEFRRDRPDQVDQSLSAKVLNILDSNPHASPEFLAERIALLLGQP